jgi:hypothetical protein
MSYIDVGVAVKLVIASWALVPWSINLGIISGPSGSSWPIDFILVN